LPYIGNSPALKYASFAVQHFTTSATTTYTLDHAVANENDIRLVINNVIQQPGSGKAYTASATTLTLSSATSGTDTMYCVFLGKAVQTVVPPAGSVTESTIGASNSPTNGYVLSAQSGAAGGLTWAADAGGAALTGSTNNQVTTVTGANAIQGETNLIYNGTILGAGADGANADLGTGLHVKEADSSGSVNSTYASLVIEGSGSCGMQFLGGTSGNQEIRFGDSGSNSIGWIKYDNNDNSMNFRVNEDTRMHIDSSGYLKCLGVYTQSAGDSANVVVDGSGNIYRSTSALKYKQDVRDLESIDISSFRPVRYKSKSPKDDPNKDFLGFIADEFHDAGLTELVSYNISYAEDDTKKENPIYEVEGFNYDRLTAILTKSLQEANEKIKILETKVAALESA
jgi:hypothetical protein